MPTVADLSPWLLRSVAFAWGALWGSFLQVVVHRWPRGQSIVSPGSRCPHCQKPVPSWHNVPIVGFLWLRGRTACCGKPLALAYLRSEVLSALLALAIVERFVLQGSPARSLAPALLEALLLFAFAGGLLVATFVDLEWMLIPDEVTLPGAALGLATISLRQQPDAFSAALGAGIGYLVVQVGFVWLYQGLAGRRGMGEGDAKLLLFIGAFLGWQGVLFALAAGSLQGLIAAALARATGTPLTRQHLPELPGELAQTDTPPDNTGIGQLKLPFGPFLSLAALEYLFFGETLLDAYFGWLGRLAQG